MTYENPFGDYMVGEWVLDGLKWAFVTSIDSIVLGNFGFVLQAGWTVGLFLLRSTKAYAFGACGLWLLNQL